MIENLEYFVLLLPGFFIYITLIRFLGNGDKRNDLETVFYSLMLSIVVAVFLTLIEKITIKDHKILTFSINDWTFGMWIIISYVIFTTGLLFFFKKVFPWIEKKTQIFDNVKSTTKDILYDVLDDKLITSKLSKSKSEKPPIWVHILTKDNISYTGNLVFQGLTKDKKEAIYIKQPKITNQDKPLNIDPLEGLLIQSQNIKWIGIINTDYKPDNKKE